MDERTLSKPMRAAFAAVANINKAPDRFELAQTLEHLLIEAERYLPHGNIPVADARAVLDRFERNPGNA